MRILDPFVLNYQQPLPALHFDSEKLIKEIMWSTFNQDKWIAERN